MPESDLTIAERVDVCRVALQGEEPLPDWDPTRWINALVYRLGQAALHAENLEDMIARFAPEDRAAIRTNVLETLTNDFIVIAAAAMDAITALEARHARVG